MAHLIRLPLSHSGSTVNSPMSIHHHHLGQGPTSFSPPPTSSPGQYKHHSPLSDIPISPPHTRSASAENTAAQLVEDFRRYSHKLRDQYEGERAHILADRQRAIEVIAEERELWEKERGMLISRIRDLETRLISKGEILSPTGVFNLDLASFGFSPAGNMFTSPTGVPIIKGPAKANASPGGSGSSDSKKSSHGHQEIKQESGRNADGSPFYAPAPQNPSRTFSTESESLRVEDIQAPRQTPIQVIQKLTPSDFVGSSQYISPEVAESHHYNVHWEKDESSNGDIIGADSIDISQIAPHLEGVPIKASAVDPVFVAQVLSPRSASPRLSPNVRPPARDVGLTLGKAHLESENKRLTMYAGHTPNHSISRFSDLVKENQECEGDETPRGFSGRLHRGSLAPIPDEDERLVLDGIKPDEGDDEELHDRPLTGLLGLTNVLARDEIFLEALTEKLEEVKNSRPGSKETSPSASVGSLSPILEMKRPRNRSIGGGGEDGRGMEGEDDEDEDEDEPVEVKLKLKSSINFGRPMGFR